LSLLGVQAIDLGHIGLFWRHADPAHKDISIAPVTVLPKVEVTKAQIKAYGAVDITPRAEGLWWPRCDAMPEVTLKRQHQVAADLRAHVSTTLKRHVTGSGTAVLVGAGAGPIAFEAARHFRGVFAFEPDFGMFGALRRNIHMHNWKNIAFYKECVGDKVGTTRMRPGAAAGDWRIDIEGVASVMQTTIDAMELDECSAIIVNGSCGDVMGGAGETLKRFSPKVIAL
jgi:FkbM family methyltransferase